MSNPEVGLVTQYLDQVNQLAVKGQSGSGLDEAALSKLVNDAIDHFAKLYNPAATLEAFIAQARFQADIVKEGHPANAEALSLAADIASRASTSPAA